MITKPVWFRIEAGEREFLSQAFRDTISHRFISVEILTLPSSHTSPVGACGRQPFLKVVFDTAMITSKTSSLKFNCVFVGGLKIKFVY